MIKYYINVINDSDTLKINSSKSNFGTKLLFRKLRDLNLGKHHK